MIRPGIVHGFLLLAALLLNQPAGAHGGVVEEDDLCIIKVNYLRAHFKIYQPRVSGHEQFCEDLPEASESVALYDDGGRDDASADDDLPTTVSYYRATPRLTGLGDEWFT